MSSPTLMCGTLPRMIPTNNIPVTQEKQIQKSGIVAYLNSGILQKIEKWQYIPKYVQFSVKWAVNLYATLALSFNEIQISCPNYRMEGSSLMKQRCHRGQYIVATHPNVYLFFIKYIRL